jgi:hypothetical protein
MNYYASVPAASSVDKRWFANGHKYVPVSRAVRHDGTFWTGEPNISATVCPVCSVCPDEYQHPQCPQVVPGEDNYEAGWGGRGDLTVLPFEGECGHSWALCFGFHKGMTAVFVAVPR